MESGMSAISGYKPGWHVFRTRGDARQWGYCASDLRIVKVFVRGVTKKGHVAGGTEVADCFVAREIFIPLEKVTPLRRKDIISREA